MHTDQPFVKKAFCDYLRGFRSVQQLSKTKMAERLHMDLSSYRAIERGVYGPSATTVVLFMLQLPEEERLAFLSNFNGLIC